MSFDTFLKTLPVSGLGMSGVFIVMAVVYAVIILTNKYFTSSEE